MAKSSYSNIPAIEADMRFAIVPASMARTPSLVNSPLLFGASELMPPISMPIVPRLAKPHNANVAITYDRGSRDDFCAASMDKATNSFSTMRVPSRLPMAVQSLQGTPITQATGANNTPKILSRLLGNEFHTQIHYECRPGCHLPMRSAPEKKSASRQR